MKSALWMFDEIDQIKIDNEIFDDAYDKTRKNSNTLQEYGIWIQRNWYALMFEADYIGRRQLMG